MKYAPTTYHSRIYREFRSIDSNEWRTIIRFFEEYEGEIKGLEFEEYFELLLTYANALFEIGAYEKYLLMSDVLIEESMTHNVKFFHGEDVFRNTLFRKAASCYHLHNLEKSDYILRESLRIDPYDEITASFLKKCLRRMRPAVIRQTRAAAVFLVIMSALVICIEMLFVRIFYPMYTDLIELTRNSTLLLSLLVIAGGEVFHRLRADREVENFIELLKKRKKRRENG